jgi:hypothetical protein
MSSRTRRSANRSLIHGQHSAPDDATGAQIVERGLGSCQRSVMGRDRGDFAGAREIEELARFGECAC